MPKKRVGAVAYLRTSSATNVGADKDSDMRQRDGKCEGRKSHAEERPEVVDLVKRLHKQGMGYRAISGELERAGHVNERGKAVLPQERARNA
jgi:hypothetical protein